MKRVISDTRFPVRIWASDLEQEAEEQTRKLAGMPFLAGPVALMPDAHAGKGSTVGTVIATRGAIIPAAVGVDIGCGMCAVKIPYKVDLLSDLPALRHSIERAIPTGRFGHKELDERRAVAFISLGANSETDERVLKNAALQLGSLGGGNHFIEICGDEDGWIWVMLHSGSRNIGKRLADVHIQKAKDLMKAYFIDLPNPDLAYLAQGTPEFEAYLYDLQWAQSYAKANRNEMMERTLEQLYRHLFKDEWARLLAEDKDIVFRVDCHHNYTAIENHGGKNIYVTRKGAVSAKEGEFGIIPGSMGTRSYIVQGLGNPDSYCSCSHGAGRRMSRTKARETFSKADLEAQTQGVECRKDEALVDEIPGAYKSIDQVMADQDDLVQKVSTLKQLLCIKGD